MHNRSAFDSELHSSGCLLIMAGGGGVWAAKNACFILKVSHLMDLTLAIKGVWRDYVQVAFVGLAGLNNVVLKIKLIMTSTITSKLAQRRSGFLTLRPSGSKSSDGSC